MADQPDSLSRGLVAPGQEAAFIEAWQELAVVFFRVHTARQTATGAAVA